MFHIVQHIQIGSIKIESINNSSMLQIGTSGGINAVSHVQSALGPTSTNDYEMFEPSLVPLPNPN